MSFCSDVKNELVLIRPSECCKPSLTYGLMLFGRSFSYNRISMQSTNPEMIQIYSSMINTVYGIKPQISIGGKICPTYKAIISSESDRLKILASVDFGISETLINDSEFNRECCFQSFVRGAFLASGSINDPLIDYRAEFSVRNKELALEFKNLLSIHGIELKITSRNNVTVLYTKKSETIEDLLTLIGASRWTLDIIDTKILKSVKNNINRASNCDSANISKTVEASIKQRTAIDYLEKSDILYSLPEELVSAAILRKENPESTLKELCVLSADALTVSGLNHRLSKIVKIYEEVKNDKSKK